MAALAASIGLRPKPPSSLKSFPYTLFRRIQCSIEDLKGQRVAVVGLGVSGRAAVKLALSRGASVLAIDKNEQMVPLERDPQFVEYADLQTMLGYCDNMHLANADRIVVSPGVPLQEYDLSSLLHSGKLVMSELDFAAEALPQSMKILAVTGTNGKSTVTTFAGQMLHHFGIEIFVGGNLGKPLSDAAFLCLHANSIEDMIQVAVVEVSSYQLEIPTKYFSPSVAVILNLTPDHLERHKTLKNYAETKCRLFSHLKHNKLAILPVGNQYMEEAYSKYTDKCNLAWIEGNPGIKTDFGSKVATFSFPTTGIVTHLQLGDLKAIGAHNHSNAAVAAFSVLGLDVGIDCDFIKSTVGILSILPHRMQVVCIDAHGITWVDDSKATNVESTLTGLKGLKEHNAVVLLGGVAKALNDRESNGFEQLIDDLKHHKGVITFGSSGAMIQKTLCDGGLEVPCVRAMNLKQAVDIAKNMATYGLAFFSLKHTCSLYQEPKLSSFGHFAFFLPIKRFRCK
ncbi:uncharacterized protein LOC103973737 isoform X1 [Musa acuminata AAA Group]|uniref:uncharacterized protein LOC103973737 isoform X1 n=2 Tax=Musa acuminata AAA Group TaxID=214697 RepID=UPI0031E1D220